MLTSTNSLFYIAFLGQIFQNAVENANLQAKATIANMDATAKQTIRHADLAIDRQWNLDEIQFKLRQLM